VLGDVPEEVSRHGTIAHPLTVGKERVEEWLLAGIIFVRRRKIQHYSK